MIDHPILMMRTFVVIVNEHREAQRLGHREFARRCWPESSPGASGMRWQAMRTKSRNSDRPQGILIFDAQRMASALNIDLAYLMLECTIRTQEIIRKNKELKQVTERNEE